MRASACSMVVRVRSRARPAGSRWGGAKRLQEGFLRMQRDRAAAASRGRALGAARTRLTRRLGEMHRGRAGRDWSGVGGGAGDTSVREIDGERLFRKAVAVPAGPRFGANRDARRVEVRNQRARQIAPINKQLIEWTVRRHRGQYLRERRVLGLIGRPDHGVDDHVGVHQLHDVAFEAGEGADFGFTAVSHGRVADRRLAVGGHRGEFVAARSSDPARDLG